MDVTASANSGDFNSGYECHAGPSTRGMHRTATCHRIVIGDRKNSHACRRRTLHQLGRRTAAVRSGCVRMKVDQCVDLPALLPRRL